MLGDLGRWESSASMAVLQAEGPSNEKQEFQLYVDAHDVIQIMLGAARYYDGASFDPAQYAEARTLTYSLMMAGRLQNLCLLPPHQAEFLDFIWEEQEVMGSEEHVRFGRFKQDWARSQRLPEVFKADSKALALTPHEFLGEAVKVAEPYFNLLQTLRGGGWRARLRRLHEQRIVVVQDYAHGYDPHVTTTEEFQLLLAAIDQERPKGKGRSRNFNDAYALSSLLKIKDSAKNEIKLELEESSKTKIPILFDSMRHFEKYVETAGLSDRFTYHNELIGRSVSILRGPEDFTLRAIEYPSIPDNTRVQIPTEAQSTRNARLEQMPDSAFIAGDVMEMSIESGGHGKSEFEALVDEHDREFTAYMVQHFCDKIWIPLYAEGEYREVLSGPERTVLTCLSAEENESTLHGNVLKTYEVASWGSRVFTHTGRLWRALAKASDNLAHTSESQLDKGLWFYLDYGLFRFSITNVIDGRSTTLEAKLERILLDSGLHSPEPSDRKRAIKQIITNVVNGCINDNRSELAQGMAALWVLDMYKEIDDILEAYAKRFASKNDKTPGAKEYPDYSLALLHCAAILHASARVHDRERVLRTLKCMENKTKDGTGRRYRVYAGEAYIRFLLWNKTSRETSFSTHTKHPAAEPNEDLRRAIDLSKKAYEYLTTDKNITTENADDRTIFSIYALNLYVLATVEGGGKAEFDGLFPYVESLIKDRTDKKDLWQARYDDTLARYYFRQALYYADGGPWSFYLGPLLKAKRYSKEAIDNAVQDKQIYEAIGEKIDHYWNISHNEKDKFVTDFVKEERKRVMGKNIPWRRRRRK